MKHTQEYFRDFFLFYGIASGLEAAQIFLDCLDVLWQQLSGIILVKGARYHYGEVTELKRRTSHTFNV
ncbi:MAG: hypothetical protein HFH85_20420 [Lachnospiraceae bacterium]|nr:hypothetical protein [Lachnospiraceae bacterium]